MTRALLRMADANLNRGMEGLRVAEDVMRFVRQDARGSAEARRLRHAMRRAADGLAPRARMVGARNAATDPGRRRVAAGPRAGTASLLAANLRRAQESARVLEECGRALGRAGAARAFQRIRYGLYRLESRTLA